MEHGDYLRHVLRDALEHEDAEDGAQHRQGYELTHGVQEGGDAAGVHNERRDNNCDAACDGAVDLADLNTLGVGSFWLMDEGTGPR